VPEALAVVLDQNVPRAVAAWLRTLRPSWQVHHAAEVGLARHTDRELFEWAQPRRAIIITFDEDFADQRSFPVGRHHGVVRLRVWPTTIEEVQNALGRLLAELADETLPGALVIIDRNRIRVRGLPSSTS
jgi:predicted nuclease of predicted toxin-antitoxin system